MAAAFKALDISVGRNDELQWHTSTRKIATVRMISRDTTREFVYLLVSELFCSVMHFRLPQNVVLGKHSSQFEVAVIARERSDMGVGHRRQRIFSLQRDPLSSVAAHMRCWNTC